MDESTSASVHESHVAVGVAADGAVGGVDANGDYDGGADSGGSVSIPADDVDIELEAGRGRESSL